MYNALARFVCARSITLGARDFASAVSGFCQVFIVIRAKSFAARGVGLRPKMCRPSANTQNSHRTREKPLVPRVEVNRFLSKYLTDHAAAFR